MKLDFNKTFEIAGRKVGVDAPVLVIAEGGVAHFGEIKKAFALIDMAVEAGADIFKTQIFDTDKLVSPSNREWHQRMKSRELPYEDIAKMKTYCGEKGITFVATAHEQDALAYLHKELKVEAFKVGSGEVLNWPYLSYLGGLGKPVIISTGMYEMSEIQEALKVLADAGCRDVAVLHCVTMYPTAPALVNLRVMETIAGFFDGPVGYSDHTVGMAIPLAAVARGAKIVEKHITIDVNVPNAQDWKVSCTPDNLGQFVEEVRAIEAAIGDGNKRVTGGERASIAWARKSLLLSQDTAAGTKLTREMIDILRPGTGIPPSRMDEVIGRTLNCQLEAGTILDEAHLEAK